MQADKKLVIYDHRVRWVAVINLAFFVACIWFAFRFCSDFERYLLLAFCTPFCLFWGRDLVFGGFKLMLVSDGRTLRWQERKEVYSVPLAKIRKILIGVRKPGSVDLDMGSTYVRFQLRNGTEHALPPNIASGLSCLNWRHLKRLVSHIRTVSEVAVEPIKGVDLCLDGWEDEPQHPANGSQPSRSVTNSTPEATGSRR